MKRKYWTYSIFIWFFTMQVQAQQWQALTNEFPFVTVTSITQDAYGILWFGTRGGLVEYNGYTFQNFINTTEVGSLQSSYIQSLLVDHQNRLWVGCRLTKGLQLYDRNKKQFRLFRFFNSEENSPVEQIDIYSIAEDLDGLLWIGTDQGLYTFDPATEQTIENVHKHHSEDPFALTTNTIWSLYVDHSNTVWVGSTNGLNRYNRETQKFANFNNQDHYLKGQILTIKETTEKELWVSARRSKDKIYRYLPALDSFEPVYQFPDTVGIYFNFDFSQDGSCWIASRSWGALKLDLEKDTLTFFDGHKGAIHGLSEYRNQVVFVDRFENVWIGGTRLYKLPGSNKKFDHIKGNGYAVISILDIGKEVIYGLNDPFVWNKETRQSKPFWNFGEVKNVRDNIKRSTYPKLIYEIQRFDENTIYFTTNRSVWRYDLQTGSAVQFPQDRGGLFLDFVFGDAHDMLIAEGNSYVISFDFETGESQLEKSGPLSKALYCRTASKDPTGKLWFAYIQGLLYRYDDTNDSIETFELSYKENGKTINASRINEILPHSDLSIWAATSTGLWHMNDQRQVDLHLDITNGLPSNEIKSLQEDLHGNLWISGLKGISHYNLKDSVITNYDQSDGLLNTGYGNSISTKGPDGHLYFGGDMGIDLFHPDDIGHNAIPPELYIDQININGSPFSPDTNFYEISDLVIQYDENFIDIDLVAVHQTAPLANKYMYKLNDRQWVQNGKNRKIALANLSPGSYTIYGKASNADGIWSEQKKLLNFQVRPPWWKSWWFSLVSALVICAFIYLLYRYRINQVKKQESLQTAFNKKIAEIEMKALRAQMNPHFLFNSLNSVKSLISKGENVPATAYLTRFSQLIRQVLNNSRKKFIRLNDELNALRLYLELEAMRFADSFEYEIQVGENVNPDFLEIPPMILQPFVENAIWHGLMHKLKGPRKVIISIERKEDLVLMHVEDNGIGRKAARELHTRSSSKQESLGIQITQDRLLLIRELYGTSADISIEDMYGHHQNPKGTRVRITLPIPE